MKNLIVFLLLTCGFLFACNNDSSEIITNTNEYSEIINSEESKLELRQVNSIPVATAENWISNWKNLLLNSTTGPLNTNPVHSFTMDRVNLEQVIATGATSTRLHIGYDGNEAKLMIVGVDANGQDMLDSSQPLQQYYDYTNTCPPWCDTIPSINSANSNSLNWPINNISTETADSWINDWQNLLSYSTTGPLNTSPVHSFSMDLVNLEQVLAAGAYAARFHFGFDGSEAKLLIVGVDTNGKDMLDASQPLENYYDYTATCPPYCGN